jgi:hypothetical protein
VGGVVGEEESSFCEQKEAKKLFLFVHDEPTPYPCRYGMYQLSSVTLLQESKKFFGSFFQKRTLFLAG